MRNRKMKMKGKCSKCSGEDREERYETKSHERMEKFRAAYKGKRKAGR